MGNPVLFKVSETRRSKAISRVKWIVGQFNSQRKQYDFRVAWYGLMWWVGVYSGLTNLSIKSIRRLNDSLDAYIKSKYGDIISKYQKYEIIDRVTIPIEKYPIWVFWWQGVEGMPKVVRRCYELINRNNENVTLLTIDNVREYIDIPEAVFDKVRTGEISYTHFSDILRLTLLSDKGGMWIDATCFNPYAIPEDAKKQIFYSPHDRHKQKKLAGNYMYWCDSGGWRSWNIGTNIIRNPLFAFSSELITALAVNEKCFPNYFMVDCMISYAYRNFNWAKNMIDNMPDFNTRCADLFLLYFNANKQYDEEEYKQLIENDWIFKLTYKSVWLKRVDGKLTFYGKLLSD